MVRCWRARIVESAAQLELRQAYLRDIVDDFRDHPEQRLRVDVVLDALRLLLAHTVHPGKSIWKLLNFCCERVENLLVQQMHLILKGHVVRIDNLSETRL